MPPREPAPPPRPVSPRVARGVSVVTCALVVAAACCSVIGAVGRGARISEGVAVGVASTLAMLFARLAWRAPRASFGWSLVVGAVTGALTTAFVVMSHFVEPDPNEGSIAGLVASVALGAGAVLGIVLALLLGLVDRTLRTGDDAHDAGDELLARTSLWLVLSGGPLWFFFLHRGFLGATGALMTTTGAALALFVLHRDVSRWRLLARVAAGADPHWVMIDAPEAISRPLRPYVRSDPARCRAALAARQVDGSAFRSGGLPMPAVAIDADARLARSLLRRRAILTSIALVLGPTFPFVSSRVRPTDPSIKPVASRPVDAPLLGSQPYRIDLEGPAADLAMSDTAACAVLRSGKVQCWGSNEGRFPGLPRFVAEPHVLPWIGGVRAIALGGGHACVIEERGLVSCWGKGAEGQLGDGERAFRDVPVPVVGIGEVTQLALFGSESCALVKGGEVACWGEPASTGPRCTDDDPRGGATPAVVGGLFLTEEIAPGTGGFYARSAGGQVSLVGRSEGSRPAHCLGPRVAVPIDLPSPARHVFGGSTGGCALLRDGGAVCWGYNESACRESGDVPYAEENLREAAAVAVGSAFTCTLRGGAVACWGFCGFRRGGIRTGTGTPVPVPGLDGVERIAAGLDVACALRRDGSVWCWGDTAAWVGSGL